MATTDAPRLGRPPTRPAATTDAPLLGRPPTRPAATTHAPLLEPTRPAVTTRVRCQIRAGPGGGVHMSSAVAGPVHPVLHRGAPGPDVLLLSRDTAGLAGGDTCHSEIDVDGGVSIVISDPGPTSLFPSCDGRLGHQTVDLTVGPMAQAVLLPHATVPFAFSQTATAIRVRVAPDGVAVLGSVVSPGRVARGEVWEAGLYQQLLEITCGDELLACDAFGVRQPRILGPGHLVSLLAYQAGAARHLDWVRVAAGDAAGVSAVTDDLLVVRAIVGSCAAGYALQRRVVSVVLPELANWEWSRIGYPGPAGGPPGPAAPPGPGPA